MDTNAGNKSTGLFWIFERKKRIEFDEKKRILNIFGRISVIFETEKCIVEKFGFTYMDNTIQKATGADHTHHWFWIQ